MAHKWYSLRVSDNNILTQKDNDERMAHKWYSLGLAVGVASDNDIIMKCNYSRAA